MLSPKKGVAIKVQNLATKTKYKYGPADLVLYMILVPRSASPPAPSSMLGQIRKNCRGKTWSSDWESCAARFGPWTFQYGSYGEPECKNCDLQFQASLATDVYCDRDSDKWHLFFINAEGLSDYMVNWSGYNEPGMRSNIVLLDFHETTE